MTDSASQMLNVFESLSAREKHEVLIALQFSGELPDTLVSDDQRVGIADELFQTLDLRITELAKRLLIFSWRKSSRFSSC